MFAPGEPRIHGDLWRPRGARWLEAPLSGLDRLFDRIYSSAYNPLHRTGTLAALFLTVALVTGVYLIFVYEIARPYQSMLAIQSDVRLGRWIRALHRYASDAAVVAVALHVLRSFVQGKTWGPRTLAWITGVLLTGMMGLSAVTGFVLVWDQFGQALAIAGAKTLRLLPLFPEPPDRAFVGDKPVPSQFFFMNLFLHIAIPLGMVGFLWLHTARLARATWFPERRVIVGSLLGLVLLSLVWPAPLAPPADLLTTPGRIPADWFYAFWLPLAAASPGIGLAVTAVLGGLLTAVPWLFRPRRVAALPPAFADPDVCEGCRQCFQDCPFDAIEMVTGRYPERHALLAEVQTSRCVSCGLCAASCSSLAIGPEGRTARDQLTSARQLVASHADPARRTLFIVCRNNAGVAERLSRQVAADGSLAFFAVECGGTLHPGTVSYLGGHFGGTMIFACPPRNCMYREGATLADARLIGEQKPAVPGRIAQLRVRLLHASMGEWSGIASAIEEFTRAPGSAPGERRHGLGRRVVAPAFSIVLLGLIAFGSGWPQGADADSATLRLGWRLVGQVRESCRDLSAEEQAARPVHMRRLRECVSEVLAYDLTAAIDGQVVAGKRVQSPGLRGDRPLSVEEDLEIRPGDHTVTVTFKPADPASGGKMLAFDGMLRFERGRVVLIAYEGDRLVAR